MENSQESNVKFTQEELQQMSNAIDKIEKTMTKAQRANPYQKIGVNMETGEAVIFKN